MKLDKPALEIVETSQLEVKVSECCTFFGLGVGETQLQHSLECSVRRLRRRQNEQTEVIFAKEVNAQVRRKPVRLR